MPLLLLYPPHVADSVPAAALLTHHFPFFTYIFTARYLGVNLHQVSWMALQPRGGNPAGRSRDAAAPDIPPGTRSRQEDTSDDGPLDGDPGRHASLQREWPATRHGRAHARHRLPRCRPAL